MDLNYVIANPDMYVVIWVEPYPDVDENGNEITGTDHYCEPARKVIRESQKMIKDIHGDIVDELTALEEFICIYWATIREIVEE